jgi:hypothetical protein
VPSTTRTPKGSIIPPTKEQEDAFLDLIRAGEVRPVAAREVGSTGSRFKSLIGRDAEFKAKYVEALEQSGRSWEEDGGNLAALEKGQLVAKIFDEYVERALDPEKAQNGSANRLLHNLALLLNSTFEPLLKARLHRHVHEGAVGIFAVPQIDTSRWSLEEHEEFVQLEARRNELIAKASPVATGKHPSLPPGVPGVIDAEPAAAE